LDANAMQIILTEIERGKQCQCCIERQINPCRLETVTHSK
jgi:hypothetical protein